MGKKTVSVMPYWTKEHTVSQLGRLRLQSPIGQRALQKNKPEWEKVSEKKMTVCAKGTSEDI